MFAIMASEYLEAALREFRVLLSDIDTRNADAMFAFAIIVSVSMMVQLRSSTTTEKTWSGLLDSLAAFFECLHGARKLVVTGGLWCQNGIFSTFLANLRTKEGQVDDPGIKHALLSLKKLESQSAHLSLSPSQRQLYGKAIEGLRTCWLRKVFAVDWLIDVGKGFQTELRNEEVMAKLVLAHWGASLYALDKFWWAQGVGKSIVEHATQSLVSSGTRSNFSVNWARQHVGLEPNWLGEPLKT